MFEIILSDGANDFIAKANPPLRRKIEKCFTRLETDPHHNNNIKRLSGEFAGYLRYRLGDWRVIFQIDEKAHQVLIADIAHRREVYE